MPENGGNHWVGGPATITKLGIVDEANGVHLTRRLVGGIQLNTKQSITIP